MRGDVGCPLPLAYVFLGERFGQWPWSIEDEPADKVAFYLHVLGVEGEVRALTEGVDPEEDIVEVN